ncbi:hypothetical protein, partial [Burkholderia pyrrocinia]|uniref:hypothetical protein n=1 Tax=Burkholderia pyrrocinia TaxID=60550 RepID=UPI001404D527
DGNFHGERVSRVESGSGGGARRALARPAGADMMLRRPRSWCLFNRLLRSAAIGGSRTRRRSRAVRKGALLCRIKYVFPDSAVYSTRFTQLLFQSE